MNTLTLTAVIDGNPQVFRTSRKTGETNIQVELRLVKAVLAFIETGGFDEWESAEWTWS